MELVAGLIALVLLIAFASALVQSTVGFGYALLFVPAAALAIGAQSAVAISILTGTIISAMLYVEHHPRASLPSVVPLVLAAVVGAPIGVALLLRANEDVLHLLVGGVVLTSALVNMAQRGVGPSSRPDRWPLQVAAGFTSGVLRGAVSMPGPPVVLYQHWVGGGSGNIRSKMFAFLFWMSLPTAAIAAVGGVFDGPILGVSLLAIPAILVGVIAGRALRPRLAERAFSQLSMLLLALTSAVAIAGAALALVG